MKKNVSNNFKTLSLYIVRNVKFLYTCFYCSIFFGLFSTNYVSAQFNNQQNIDSLLSELSKPKPVTEKIKTLNLITTHYTNLDPEAALKYANQAVHLAIDEGTRENIAQSKNLLGRAQWRLGDFDNAIANHKDALRIWEELKNEFRVALTYLFIGQDYADSGDYANALTYLKKSLKLYQEQQNTVNFSTLYSIIAWVYDNMGLYEKAHEYQYKFLKIAEESNDLNAMAIGYANLANTYVEDGNFEEAVRIYKKSIKILEDIGDNINASLIYGVLGNCYSTFGKDSLAIEQYYKVIENGEKTNNSNIIGQGNADMAKLYMKRKDYAQASIYLDKAITSMIDVNNKQNLAGLYNLAGTCYTHLKNYKVANLWFERALLLANDLKSPVERNNYYMRITELDSATNQWKSAYEHIKLYMQTQDSLYNISTTKKIAQTEMQYKYDKIEAAAKVEQEKKDIRQRSIRNSIAGALLGSLLFLVVVYLQGNKIKKEKKHSDELLLNILPSEVAEELKAKGRADARMIEEVTVLFSDFKGFTSLSEQMSPHDLVNDLNKCFSAFDRIMEKHGMEKIKTIGDSYMAAGGLPSPNTSHAYDAVNAAIEMCDFISEEKAKKAKNGLPYFEIRIGIHTGPVVAGIVGVKKFQYDIWGDTVNTASRIESSGESGKVNISQATYDLLKDCTEFKFESRGKIEAKGKGEIDMYFISKAK